MGQPARPGTRRHLRLRAAVCAFALAGATALASCGGDDGPGTAGAPAASTPPVEVSWTLVLDYEPNAVHAGLLRALAAGYFRREGIELEIVAPSSTSDALTQVSRGRADLGLADLIDVARRNERALGATKGKAEAEDETPGVRVVGALVQRPLSGLIVDAAGPVKRPADLKGRRIAVSGLPSDLAVIDAIVRGADGPLPVKPITLGFNGLKALSAGRVDATTAYWPADAVTLQGLGKRPRTFALDEFGGPRYPGLVAFAAEPLATRDPEHVQGFQDALTKGIQDVVADPAKGLDAIADAYPELDPATTEAQLDRYRPLFGTTNSAGQVVSADVEAFATFAAKSDLTEGTLTAAQILGTDGATATP